MTARKLFLPLLAALALGCDAEETSPLDTTSGGTGGTSSDPEPGTSGEPSTTAGSTTVPGAESTGVPGSTGADDPTGLDTDTTTSSESTDTGESGGSEESSGCGDVDSDPDNCGVCGNVCEAPSNGTPVCQSSECAADCNPGYDDVDLDGDTRCSKFAGFFLRRETGVCEAENPFTGDCTCPSGFDDRPVSSWRVQPNDGASWVQLAVCSPIASDAKDAWGGLFAQYEDGGACAFPNPLNIPLCTCPAGHTVTSQWRGSNINGDGIVVNFCSAGAYEDDALFVGGFTQGCGGGCAAGDCQCPAGSVQVDYPTVLPGCTTQSSFCYQP